MHINKKEFEVVTIEDLKKMELIVAEVLEAKDHPNADKLYVLRIKTGEEEKQIVAGIRGSYTKEQLIGRRIVVVNNLEPVVIRGEESNGMLLAVRDEKGVALLGPDRSVPAGSLVG